MTYRLELELDGLPRWSSNSRVHWATRARETKGWHFRIGIAISAKRAKPAKPLTKAKVTLTRRSSVRSDHDNLCSSLKGVLDGLVVAGVIADDSFNVIGTPEYRWEYARPREGGVRILVEEISELLEEQT